MAASIPLYEFKERAKKLQALMRENDLDIVLSYGNEAEPQYLRYFSNYWPSFETGAALIPVEGEPMLLIGPESLSYASDRSTIPTIRLLKAFRESSEPEYPGKKLDTFPQVFDEALGGRRVKRIGVAGLPLMTIGVYQALREAVPDAEIVKADDLVNRLRMIKTENELVCMREAAGITHRAFDYVLENVHAGMTETQVVGLALGKIHELGAERESYPFWVLAGEGGNQAISRPRDKVIREGDEVMMQFGARVASYASSIGRSVVFGRANDRQKRMIEAAYILHQMVLDTAKEGMPANVLAEMHRELAEKIGFGGWVLYGPCHGNGTMEGEAPWVETSADFVLQENMTFCLDIFLGDDETKRGLRVEDVIRITRTGVENLTDYPKKIFEIL